MEEGWTEIMATGEEYKATMAKDLLEETGIRVVIVNQHDSTYMTFGDFLVFVSDRDVERALEIIKELKG